MTMDTPDRRSHRHLLIAGTGRAGTSFLVRYLTGLGFDTHLARHGEKDSWDESAHAGLETVPLPHHDRDLPYVLKYPWLYQCIDQILSCRTMKLDAVIIPVRDLGEAAISRTLVELQAMHRSLPWMAELDQSWEVWGSTPGGVTYSLNPLDQGRLLAVGFHHLIERLVRADIPIVLLSFPRLVEDPHYLFRTLQPILPATVSDDTAIKVHASVGDLEKIRVRIELDAATQAVSLPPSQVSEYATHEKLDSIAVRRELTGLRKLLSDAKAVGQRARNEAATAQVALANATAQTAAANAAENNARQETVKAWEETARATSETVKAQEEAKRAREETLTAKDEAIKAREEANRAREETSSAIEATARARQEAHALRAALAQAGQALQAEIEQRTREVALLRNDVAHLRKKVVMPLSEQVLAARAEAARWRHDLELVYASRSWRLSRPYRAFGAALRLMREGGRSSAKKVWDQDQPPAPEPALQALAADQPQGEEYPSPQWPIWLSENTFVTKRYTYTLSKDQFEGLTEVGTVALLKDRTFVEVYRDLLQQLQPQRVFEIGFFQGGMPLFLADMLPLEKVVAIDYLQPSDALRAMIAEGDLQDTIKLFGGILQDDTPMLREIVGAEFAERPLDLIIDDASHEYENSRNCFQELFGYLRPGGKYVIEDWGWLHWPGEQWQTAKSYFWNKPAMTNLIFELIMTLGSQHPKIIARLEVLSWACVVITRGDGLAHGERIELSATRLTSGRQFRPL
jgi:SAM-dependent methyltransferase